jgi:hypothetical protein
MEKIRQKREAKTTLVWTVMGNFHLLEKKLRAGNETQQSIRRGRAFAVRFSRSHACRQ